MPIIRQTFKTASELLIYKEIFKFYAFVNDSVVWLFKQTVKMKESVENEKNEPHKVVFG